jgi:hypothetical protein
MCFPIAFFLVEAHICRLFYRLFFVICIGSSTAIWLSQASIRFLVFLLPLQLIWWAWRVFSVDEFNHVHYGSITVDWKCKTQPKQKTQYKYTPNKKWSSPTQRHAPLIWKHKLIQKSQRYYLKPERVGIIFLNELIERSISLFFLCFPRPWRAISIAVQEQVMFVFILLKVIHMI